MIHLLIRQVPSPLTHTYPTVLSITLHLVLIIKDSIQVDNFNYIFHQFNYYP